MNQLSMFSSISRGLTLRDGSFVAWGTRTEEAARSTGGTCDYWQDWIVVWTDQSLVGKKCRVSATSARTHAIYAFTVWPEHLESEAKETFALLLMWLRSQLGQPSEPAAAGRKVRADWEVGSVVVSLRCEEIKNVLCCWIDVRNFEEEQNDERRPAVVNRARCKLFPQALAPMVGRSVAFEAEEDGGGAQFAIFPLDTTDIEVRAEPFVKNGTGAIELTIVRAGVSQLYTWRVPDGLTAIQFYPYLSFDWSRESCKVAEAFGGPFILAVRLRLLPRSQMEDCP